MMDAGLKAMIEEQSRARRQKLRDEFASAALTGMLAHSTRYRPRVDAPLDWHNALAQEAYEIADAMIAARGRQE